MEETVGYTSDSHSLYITEEQLRTLSLNPPCDIVPLPSEITQLRGAVEENAVAANKSMQKHSVASQQILQPVLPAAEGLLQTGILVDNNSTIQTVSSASVCYVTVPPVNNQFENTSDIIVSPEESIVKSSYDCNDFRPNPHTAVHIIFDILDGLCVQVNLPGEVNLPAFNMENSIIKRIVTEALSTVYDIDEDLSAIMVRQESLGQSKSIPAIAESSKSVAPVVVNEATNTEEEPQPTAISLPEEEPESPMKVDEVSFVQGEEIVEISEMTSSLENTMEEGELDDSQDNTVKLVVCSYCKFSTPDQSVCQRCRRALCPPTPPTSESPRDTISSESDASPIKHERSHRGDCRRRKLHRKCKRGDREKSRHRDGPSKARLEEEKLEAETVSLLSSDEETEKKNGTERVPKTNVFEKEPIITLETETNSYESLKGGGVEVERLMDNPDLENIRLDCRSVRFGSYKVKPQDTIVLTEHGVKLKVPSLSKTPTIIKILMKDIVKVLIHFGKMGQYSSLAAPTFFYYITHEASKRIREALHMSSKNKDLFFDPTSKEEQHKRITLLPEFVTVQDRLFIKSIYESRCLMEELSWDEANDILVRAAPKEVQHNLKKDTPSVKLQPSSNNSDDIQQIMIYPPPPFKGGISINTEDYGCLRVDQFLNDVIIDFYLKYLYLNELTDEQRKCTHIFSSFFYKRLTMMPPKNSVSKDSVSPAEKRHARVKGWTKSVDIFDKDFIIIPINEKCHWFVGIICFPGLNGPVRMSDNTPVPNISRKKVGDASVLAGGQVPAKIWGTTISLVKNNSDRSSQSRTLTVHSIEQDEERGGDESERDEAEADSDEMEPDTTDEVTLERDSIKEEDLMDEATPRISKVKPHLEAIKQPCILIFDSLAMHSRAKVVATLREYLQVEWKVRHKGKPKDFSKDVFKGATPKVPQQPNFVDCGLYSLQFVEMFFKSPITDYRMPIRSIKDWFTTDVVERKRYDIMTLLHKLMKDQNIDTSQLNLPHLNLTPFDDSDEGDQEEMEDEECEYGEEGVEDEEGALGEEEEDENESDHYFSQIEAQQIQAQHRRFEARQVEVPRGLEVGRRGVEVTRTESSRPERRFELPSPRLEPRSEQSSSRPRLPDSVTICEANSKRKLPLSLKDIRTTRLSSSSQSSPTSIDKVKKARMD